MIFKEKIFIPNVTFSKSGIDDWNVRNLELFNPKFQTTDFSKVEEKSGVQMSGVEHYGVENYGV